MVDHHARWRWVELALCFGLLTTISLMVFGPWWQPAGRPYPLVFLSVPFVFWAALRLGTLGALAAVVIDAAIMTYCTLQGWGPFGVWSPAEREVLALTQVGLLVMSATFVRYLVSAVDRSRAAAEAEHRALEKAHDQLMQLDALKTHFLSTISHEMKTPLTVILGNAELLEDRHPDDPMVREILEGGHRLSGHVSRILDYCALVSGSLPLYKRDVNLGELVDNVLAMFEAGDAGKAYHLKTEVPSSLPAVEGDTRRLTQILVELLDNARKHTPPGGTIGIRALGARDQVRLEVWDTGSGFTKQETERLGMNLNHLETAESLDNGGLGLGLTIVKKLTELHGGHLEFDTALGHGTRFAVVLPAAR